MQEQDIKQGKGKTEQVVRKLELPKDIELSLSGSTVTVKGQKGELKREFKALQVKIEKKENTLIVSSPNSRRKNKALVGTIVAHISNMIKGVTQGYTYKLRAVHSHFPMTFKLQGSDFMIENFLGSKSKIKASLPEGVKVDVKGSEVSVQGIDKEKVSQAAATIEKSMHVSNKDRRVFQDGLYLVERDGVPL